MRANYLVCNIVLIAIVDLILLATVKEWSDLNKFSIMMINIALGIGIIFLVISPKGQNSNIFILSTSLIVMGYVIIEVIIGMIYILYTFNNNLVILSQIILAVLSIFILSINFIVNKNTAKSDAFTREWTKTLGQVQIALEGAMAICENRDAKIMIEKAYDATRAMTKPSRSSMEQITQELFNRSNKIFEAATKKNNMDVIRLCTEYIEIIKRRDV
ncbi:hypothetical protein [Candidatus Methanomassiliicoccus intestinalis]|uniref:hypothetical protein n=1 Tax=Candidatus Methanomassiliicoccus intestinalis TaxID=1406512 RepID=UPI0037DD517B